MRGTMRFGLALGFAAVAVTAAAAVGAPGGGGNGQEQQGRGGRPGRAMMRDRVVHGEWVVDGSFDTHRVNNGEITGISGRNVTIKRADGEVLTFTVPADARVRRGRGKATVESLKVGDRAHILEVDAGKGFVVKAVIVRPPKADAPAEEPAA